MTQPSKAYPRPQIWIHWAIVAMIAAQWSTSGAIPRTHNPLLPPSPSDLLLHMVHNYNGMAIGCLVLVRIALRLSRSTVRQQARRTPMELAALAVHWGIYASLAAQAATGFIASYLWVRRRHPQGDLERHPDARHTARDGCCLAWRSARRRGRPDAALSDRNDQRRASASRSLRWSWRRRMSSGHCALM